MLINMCCPSSFTGSEHSTWLLQRNSELKNFTQCRFREKYVVNKELMKSRSLWWRPFLRWKCTVSTTSLMWQKHFLQSRLVFFRTVYLLVSPHIHTSFFLSFLSVNSTSLIKWQVVSIVILHFVFSHRNHNKRLADVQNSNSSGPSKAKSWRTSSPS